MVLFCMLAAGFAAGCDRGETTLNGSRIELPEGVEPIRFASDTVRIESEAGVHTLRVEVAETAEQRERGLMYRTSLPEDAGMLFVYPAAQEGGFWMYNTRIPLDIAYADDTGTILQIERMEPCESPYESQCPVYPAAAPFRYALEVSPGFFAERGIRPGNRIVWAREGE